jgi:hypothetical protein
MMVVQTQTPLEFGSDNGKEFSNEAFGYQENLRFCNHPEYISQAEICNKTTAKYLRHRSIPTPKTRNFTWPP